MAWEPFIGTPDANTPGLPVRLVGLDVTAGLPNVINRPSSKTGRTQKIITVDNQTTGQTLYTVTNGKILYIESIILSGYNTGAAARLRIKDNTTVILPFHATSTGLGVLSGAVPLNAINMSFPDPIPFSNSVVVDLPSGTLVYSLTLIGYEE